MTTEGAAEERARADLGALAAKVTKELLEESFKDPGTFGDQNWWRQTVLAARNGDESANTMLGMLVLGYRLAVFRGTGRLDGHWGRKPKSRRRR